MPNITAKIICNANSRTSKVRGDGDACVRFYARRSHVFVMMKVSDDLFYIIYTPNRVRISHNDDLTTMMAMATMMALFRTDSWYRYSNLTLSKIYVNFLTLDGLI